MFISDLRHTLRQLRRTPIVTATAIATLALGVGATTAVFTLVQQVMLRTLPVAQPDQLWRIGDAVRCCHANGYAQGNWSFFSWDAYTRFRRNTPAFEHLAAFQVGDAELAVRRRGSASAIVTANGEYVSNFSQQHMIASLAWLFGAVGLLLAAVGLYGVTAFGVERRTNEIGLRIALGADRGSVVALVLRGALWQVVLGLVLGLPAAIGAGYLIASQLFGVQPWNPLMLSGSALLLAIAASIAGLIPAWRGATVDPMQALRAD